MNMQLVTCLYPLSFYIWRLNFLQFILYLQFTAMCNEKTATFIDNLNIFYSSTVSKTDSYSFYLTLAIHLHTLYSTYQLLLLSTPPPPPPPATFSFSFWDLPLTFCHYCHILSKFQLSRDFLLPLSLSLFSSLSYPLFSFLIISVTHLLQSSFLFSKHQKDSQQLTQEPRPKNQPQISREKENRLSRLIDKRKVEKSKKNGEKGRNMWR